MAKNGTTPLEKMQRQRSWHKRQLSCMVSQLTGILKGDSLSLSERVAISGLLVDIDNSLLTDWDDVTKARLNAVRRHHGIKEKVYD